MFGQVQMTEVKELTKKDTLDEGPFSRPGHMLNWVAIVPTEDSAG